MRRLFLQRVLAMLLGILSPSLVYALPRVLLAWDAPAIPGNMTLTGYQVRRCVTTACGTGCTLADLPGGAVGSAVLTYTDTAVNAAISYLYDVQSVGTVDGTSTRSLGSNQVCYRVKRPPPHSVGGGKVVR